MRGEGKLLILVERLIAKNQHRIAIHRRLDFGSGLRIDRIPQIDSRCFRREQWMKVCELERHWLVPSPPDHSAVRLVSQPSRMAANGMKSPSMDGLDGRNNRPALLWFHDR